MRGLLRLFAAAILFASAAPAAAQSLSVSDASCTEGGVCSFVISRAGSKGLTSSFRYATRNGEAVAPGDYTARSGQQSVRKNASRITISVQTTQDATHEGKERFYLVITPVSNAVIVRAEGAATISDDDLAPPPPVQCPDGSTVPAGQTCPEPPPPPATETPYPAGTPWNGLNLATRALATKTCSSIYRTAETDRVGVSYRSVLAGTVYLVPARAWGWHGPFKNIDGQSGDAWTVIQVDNPLAWATVAQECLVGLRQAQ